MIAVLSLVVAVLAVFVGPFVAWTNVQRQIAVTAREKWMRELRDYVAAFRGRPIGRAIRQVHITAETWRRRRRPVTPAACI
jgi:hypothetical protein